MIFDEIYDAVSDDDALTRLPGALARDVGARSRVIQLFAANGHLVEHEYSYFTPEHWLFYAQNEIYKVDTWREIGTRSGIFGSAFNCDDVIDPEQFRRSMFYNELFRSHGDDTGRCVGGCFSIGDQMLAVGLHRALGDRNFEAAQLESLRSTAGHVRRLYLARQTLTRANERAQQLAAALDAPSIGIVRVDLRSRLVHANAAGQDILRLNDGFALVGSTIALHTYALQQRFGEAVRSAALRTGGQGDALLVPRPSGKLAWRVVVVPDEASASGRATLLIESPGGEGSLHPRLAALYDLTRAESEVAVFLAEGLAPTEIAERREVSLETVRNQIKVLLQKTGATRLGGLIAILARTVRSR